MPVILLSIDDIMAREKRDMLFVQFGSLFERTEASAAARKQHLEWFASKGLRIEKAAPRGWWEGDPGIFAVHFDGPDDLRVAEYSAIFEDAEGKSLEPEAYRMVILSHEDWLRNPPPPMDDDL